MLFHSAFWMAVWVFSSPPRAAAPLFFARGLGNYENDDQDDQDDRYYAYPYTGLKNAADYGASLEREKSNKEKRVNPFG
jgi:hypothetical protein